MNSSSEDTRVNTQSDTSAEQPSSEQGWSRFDASVGSEDVQPVRLVLASRWQRFGGYLVDSLFVFFCYVALGVSTLLVGGASWYASVELMAWLVGPLYWWLMTGLNGGRTLGKMAMGTKVVNEDGRAPSLLTAFMREVIGKFVSAIVLGLGFIWILFDSKFQGWHDKIAGTYVIRVEK